MRSVVHYGRGAIESPAGVAAVRSDVDRVRLSPDGILTCPASRGPRHMGLT
jgi:hypothetical protein